MFATRDFFLSVPKSCFPFFDFTFSAIALDQTNNYGPNPMTILEIYSLKLYESDVQCYL